ncbi:UDP-2,3-diacylglucosamine diphosphatase [Coraliomargarita sinensis]|uniref:UDP-2,3-diacylglucosamine diphosphatase n=1 Tax=Coraliomargarita sinensis TaxID=2174842 RepID=UPI0018EEA27D|nr:UDP-2,3-diacylglucosamine diphosphatase [Coraliomargarita sinensis]
MKKTTLSYKTIFLSDVHLGTLDCKIDEVNHFLKHTHCEKLVLNGDIIDGWSLARKGGWTDQHTRFVRLVLKKVEKRHTEVVYLRGNHDDFLERCLPLFFGNIKVVNEHIHESPNGDKYLVVHGDGFDAVTINHKWLAVLGDIGYQSLLKINRFYNHYRAWRGKEYFSLSKAIKAKVKSAVSFVGKYEDQLQNLARKRECSGIICGHIHTPDDKMVGDIHYINSGDWVESLTAIVEYEDGRHEVIQYKEFCERLEKKARLKAEKKARAKSAKLEDSADSDPGPVEEDEPTDAPNPSA